VTPSKPSGRPSRLPSPDPGQWLPPEMRQLIVDLKAEHPAFRPHEIARICYVRFGRKPSEHTVKRILAAEPPPSVATRRYPPYAKTRRSLTKGAEPLSICTRKAGRIPTLPPISRRLATGCMKSSHAGPDLVMRDSMIFRSSPRAKRASGKSMSSPSSSTGHPPCDETGGQHII
jgi:hypothetical protein